MKARLFGIILVFWVIGVLWSCAGSPKQDHAKLTQTISIEVREGTKLAFDLSPDGQTIVFDLLGQLWLLPAEGGEATPLTDAVRDTAEDLDPSFSPDGKRIVFQSDRAAGRGLWLVAPDGSEVRQLTHSPTLGYDDFSPAWAPDGRSIAFIRGNMIHLIDIGTRAVNKVHIEGLPSPLVRDPSWSPDGTRLAFVNAKRWTSAGELFDGRIWEVGVRGGIANPLTAEDVKGFAPAYSPDGSQIAFFSGDFRGDGVQLWTQERSGGAAQKLTDHSDTTPLRARWSADGTSILYSADGRLWRITASGGTPQEISLVARLSLVRKRSQLRPVRFSPPGVERPARGHRGLALSPDGKRIAMIALGNLWVFAVDGTPRALATVPVTAAGLSWSPDGTEVAWSAGPKGVEDLFATSIETGEPRRLSALPGREIRPLWSPDGQNIAFEHWETPGQNPPPHLRIIPAKGKPVERLDGTREIAELASWWLRGAEPEWSPDSKALMSYHHPNGQRSPVRATFVPLTGEPRSFEQFPDTPTFFRWREDSSVIYVQNDMLWRAHFQADSGIVGEPTPVSDDPALYASTARDNSILYVSGDGLRIRRSDGSLERLGWPLTYRTPVPERLLIRNVRIIDGAGTAPTEPRDILVEAGRIVRIESARVLGAGTKARVIEGEGRVIIPGLIDLHVHIWDDVLLPGFLYNGVTTVRDVGSPIAQTAALRDAVEAGVRAGPRIVFGGFMFWSGIGVSGEFYQTPADDAGFARAMALARAFGADYVKHNAKGSPWAAEVKIIEHAHAAGFPVSGHCTYILPLVAAGIDGQEHTGSSPRVRMTIYDDMVQLLRAADLWVVPTMVVNSFRLRLIDNPSILERAEATAFLSSPHLRRLREPLSQAKRSSAEYWLRAARLRATKLHREDVRIAAGTDLELPWGLHWELEELVGVGFSPIEAIRAATGTAAHVLGADDEIGTIGEGKRADLVILDADPLEDIRNTRKIWMVIKNGQVVDRQELLQWVERETAHVDAIR